MEESLIRLRGQSLIELLIAIGIAGLFITGVTGTINVALRSSVSGRELQTASYLGQELLDAVTVVSNSSWATIASIAQDAYITLPSYAVNVNARENLPPINGINYTRFFNVIAVLRDPNSGELDVGIDDPSTKRIVVTVSWPGATPLTFIKLITRHSNFAFQQTDWSGGQGQNDIGVNLTTKFDNKDPRIKVSDSGVLKLTIPPAAGSQGMSTTDYEYVAWNDVIGWINFANVGTFSGARVTVDNAGVYGYANSSVGAIIFDCASANSPPFHAGLTCANFPKWSVVNTSGVLSGFAWNDVIGWISFSCGDVGSNCVDSDYGVTIDSVSGDFRGFAWNDVIGWISFSCVSGGNCAVVNYKVKTTWAAVAVNGALVSSIIDPGVSAHWNTVTWLGNTNGGNVQLQAAALDIVDTDATHWDFKSLDVLCSPGFSNTLAGTPVPILCPSLQKKYLRYKIRLESNANNSPRVDDVIVTWSQ